MKQNKLKFLMLLVLMFSVLSSSSQTFKSKGITYSVTSTKERAVRIIAYDNSYSKRVVIPSQVDYYGTALTVKEIDEDAFNGNKSITSVVIPSTIEKTDYLFSGCSRLASVTLGDLETIGKSTFSVCKSLTSIDIPNSVTSIGTEAFESSGLTSISIPNSVTEIGREAFAWCTGLADVTLGNSVTEIYAETFKHCRGLTSFTIPNTITYIGYMAFYDCTGLTTVTIGRSVKKIDDQAFNGCHNLIKIICEATTPPSLNEIFYPIFVDYLKPTLYVPAGSIEAYKNDPKWGQFAKIRAIE